MQIILVTLMTQMTQKNLTGSKGLNDTNDNPTGYYYVLKDHGLNQKILVRIAFKLQCSWLYLLKRTIQVVYCFLSNLYKSVYHYILRMYKALLHFIIKKHITE